MASFDTMSMVHFYKAVMVVVLGQYCGGYVLRQRWQNPCVGSRISGQQFLLSNPAVRPASPLLVTYRLWLAATDVKEATQNLRNQYLHDRIQSTDLQFRLLSNRTLPGFPNTQPLDESISLLDRVSEDFRRVSTVAVFIEQMKRDEHGSMMSPNFLSHYEYLESKMYPFLCLMELAILSQSGSTDDLHVTRDVMTQDSRDFTSAAERFNRDYRILNGSLVLFESIRADYRFLHLGSERKKRNEN